VFVQNWTSTVFSNAIKLSERHWCRADEITANVVPTFQYLNARSAKSTLIFAQENDHE